VWCFYHTVQALFYLLPAHAVFDGETKLYITALFNFHGTQLFSARNAID